MIMLLNLLCLPKMLKTSFNFIFLTEISSLSLSRPLLQTKRNLTFALLKPVHSCLNRDPSKGFKWGKTDSEIKRRINTYKKFKRQLQPFLLWTTNHQLLSSHVSASEQPAVWRGGRGGSWTERTQTLHDGGWRGGMDARQPAWWVNLGAWGLDWMRNILFKDLDIADTNLCLCMIVINIEV